MRVALLCALLTLPLRLSGAEREHWRNVRGAALQALFQDKEFADGAHFAYQFQPPGAEECYQVQRGGVHLQGASK